MKIADRLELDEQLCFALYAASNEVIRAYRPALKKIGLTYTQYLIMLVMWQDGPSTPKDIAERVMLPQNAMSPVIARLLDKKLVRKKQNPEDKRGYVLHLTKKGETLERKSAQVQYRVACQTGLTQKNLDRLRNELHRITRHMQDQSSD